MSNSPTITESGGSPSRSGIKFQGAKVGKSSTKMPFWSDLSLYTQTNGLGWTYADKTGVEKKRVQIGEKVEKVSQNVQIYLDFCTP